MPGKLARRDAPMEDGEEMRRKGQPPIIGLTSGVLLEILPALCDKDRVTAAGNIAQDPRSADNTAAPDVGWQCENLAALVFL